MSHSIGTAYFLTKHHAIRYYQGQGYEDAAAEVDRKIKEGEIFIGMPTLKEGEIARVNAEGRYTIEPDTTAQIHIEGRRWFDRKAGNTYHSVRIFINGTVSAFIPFAYGYDDHYLQTALDWLKANGYAPQDAPYGTLYLRETLHATYSVIDVTRKRDL